MKKPTCWLSFSPSKYSTSALLFEKVTGKPLFVAPLGRSVEEFLRESESHGWPSFRDNEVVWENVRVLKNSGETVAVSSDSRAKISLEVLWLSFLNF